MNLTSEQRDTLQSMADGMLVYGMYHVTKPLERRGFVKPDGGHNIMEMTVYEITEAGRAALKEQEPRK